MENMLDVRHRSTSCLQTIHELIQNCLDADHKAESGQEPYGVSKHSGWRKLASVIERELAMRDEGFRLIEWERGFFRRND